MKTYHYEVEFQAPGNDLNPWGTWKVPPNWDSLTMEEAQSLRNHLKTRYGLRTRLIEIAVSRSVYDEDES